MPRTLAWSKLTKGLIVSAVLIALVASVLTFARIGALRGETITLYMVTDRANRVIEGTEVWLGGHKVGLVKAIHFRPANTDTTERIAIEMEVLAEHAHHIRRNSDVQIRPGGSLIGEPVVHITVGSSVAAAVSDHDTLRARSQFEGRRSRAQMIARIGDSIVGVAKLAKQVLAYVDTSRAEIGQIRTRTESQIAEVGRAIETFASGRRSGGSLNRIASDTLLHRTISRISAWTDSIQQLASGPTTTIGRLRTDSTLVLQMRKALTSVDSLKAQATRRLDLSAPENKSLRQEMDRVQSRLDSLVQDAKKHPLKYLSL